MAITHSAMPHDHQRRNNTVYSLSRLYFTKKGWGTQFKPFIIISITFNSRKDRVENSENTGNERIFCIRDSEKFHCS